MKLAFQLFDQDNTGKISLKNLKNVCRDVNYQIPEEELIEMIESLDRDLDGLINEEEFERIIKTNLIV